MTLNSNWIYWHETTNETNGNQGLWQIHGLYRRDGFLLGKKYLICDRDTLFTKDVEQILKGNSIKMKQIAAGAPSMNCYSESFVKTIKHECLNKMIFLSERQVKYAVNEFLSHYNEERTHSSLDGRMPIGVHDGQPPDGKIIEFSRLGGMLKTYSTGL